MDRSLADAITKLERDRLKLQANDVKNDSDSNSNNANNNTVVIAENKVKFFFVSKYIKFHEHDFLSMLTYKLKSKNIKN